MGETTKIQWTNATWNPWYGCKKVSPGCDNCYMSAWAARAGKNPEVVTRSKTKFRDPLRWHNPGLVFTCSLSDFFIPEADGWRDEAWGIIQNTPHLTYQILTKRPGRMATRLPWGADERPWPNVWLGVSVENADYLWRIKKLQEVNCSLRFLSLEPLLGPIPNLPLEGIGWVIVGGESGGKARPMDVEWARDILAQCKAAEVPCFVKQLGAYNDSACGGVQPRPLATRQPMFMRGCSVCRGG